MIYLKTGKPGSGKTLRAVTEGMEFVAQGRKVYDLGINGLNHEATGIDPWPHDGFQAWEQAEPGSVLLVDECQQWLPTRPTGSQVPAWIEALTRHRHRGIDIVLITQDPMLVDSFVRRLVHAHQHVIRMPGNAQMSRVWTFDTCLDDIDKKGAKALNAEFKLWRFPQQNYALYKSADAHTAKTHVPQSIRHLVIGCVLVGLLVVAGGYAMSRIGASGAEAQAATVTAEPAPAPPQPAPAAPASQAKPTWNINSDDAAAMQLREYVLQLLPRVEGMPVSAPLYDGISPTTVPEIYCISSADSCTCLSEQGTRVRVSDSICRNIARDGSYNPFRRSQAKT